MNTVRSSFQSGEIPSEMLNHIFIHLSKEDLLTCSVVSKLWKEVAEQDSLWKLCLDQKDQSFKNITEIKKSYINQKKSEFIASFPKNLLQAFGGLDKAKQLPCIHLSGIRSLTNGSITLQDISAPLTLGRVIATSEKVDEIAVYSFFAIRFIDREFDADDKTKHLNIWITIGNQPSEKQKWTMITGGEEDGWPTLFTKDKGRNLDFSKTVEYVGRLVRGKLCGIRDLRSPMEYPILTSDGKSTVSLA